MPAKAKKPPVVKLVKPDPNALGEAHAKRFEKFWKVYFPVAKDYAQNKPVKPADMKKAQENAAGARLVIDKTLARSRKSMDKEQIKAFELALFHLDYYDNVIFPNSDTSRFKPKLAKRGDKGSAVKGYQALLKEWDWYKGKVDGVFGEGMEQAVEKFQGMQKLKVDGKIGKNTAARVVELGLSLGYAEQLHKIC
ncbi:MAG: peptidoglycan-binding domain-containing protein [Planctomycetota bacterium]